MKRTSSSSSLQFLAAAVGSPEAATMSSRPSYRGGRNQWRRGFSYRSSAAASSEDRGQIVTGDSHFRSVRDSNRRFRPVERSNFANENAFRPRPQPPFNPSPYPPPFHAPPPFNPGQPFSPPPPFNPGQPFSPPQPFNQNQQFRPPQKFRPRPVKPPDYRNWEFAKPGPPPDCERFTILSYNILADYLAINHRSKLYFHVPRHMLEWEWRKRSIIFELGLWSADILCFQEVDRFLDLEEELKLRGYSGIWKMRTGDPVDGCAIFWRPSRFKLLHEECIEFSKLGLRDNVAQICVLESLNQNNNKDMSALPTSSSGCNRVVICNVHVLYNPKRGEIKLGQIRVLLDRAHAISKLWDDAPVVLCGDFNCTPKSPLYNFILEQKLNLSDLPRDKVSGQASAEIRQFNPYFRAQYADSTIGASPRVDQREVSQSSLPIDVQEQSSPDSNAVNVPLRDSLSPVNSGPNISDSSSASGKDGTKNSASSNVLINEIQLEADGCKDPVCDLNEALTISHQGTVDGCKDEITSTDSASVVGTNESTTCPQNAGKFSVTGRKSGYELTTDSPHDDNLIERQHGEKGNVAINVQSDSSSEHARTNLHSEYGSMGSDRRNLSFLGSNCSADGMVDPAPASAPHPNISSPELFRETPFASPVKVSTMESSENLSPLLVADDNYICSTLSEVNVVCEPTNTDSMIDEKMENLLFSEPLETNGEDENFGEDSSKFLSELHDSNSSFSSDFSHDVRSEFAQSNKSLGESAAISHSQQLHHPGDKVLGDDSPGVDSEPIDEVNFAYDPSAWSPMEIETATGNTDCTVMEHSLKLRSTYTEIEDCSGTRDPNGEPLVTSYNRCFSGTVDYIWRSEGLQTVRVLAPIPKHAMQWTQGFPTKKWGSDHIALVSELVFVKDASSQDKEAS